MHHFCTKLRKKEAPHGNVRSFYLLVCISLALSTYSHSIVAGGLDVMS